jgi:hypothetical protein
MYVSLSDQVFETVASHVQRPVVDQHPAHLARKRQIRMTGDPWNANRQRDEGIPLLTFLQFAKDFMIVRMRP